MKIFIFIFCSYHVFTAVTFGENSMISYLRLMAIKLTPGNLYFIRDIDYLTGEVGKYVKIGIVTNDSTTEDRIKKHQTGNPRGIYPVAEVIDVPFVERLETHMHYEYNEHWITGEWFLINAKELKGIVARAEFHKAQQIKDKPVIEHVLLKLDKSISNGQIKKASKQSLALEQQIIQLKGEINVLKAKIDLSKQAFHSLLGFNGSIEGILRIKYAPGVFDFNKKAFEAAHPSLFKKYTLPRPDAFKHTLNFSNSSAYSLAKVDPTLDAAQKAMPACTYVSAQLPGKMKRTKRMEQLHADHLKLFKALKIREYAIEQLEYELKAMVGLYDGIDGICTWKRFYSPQTPAFNEAEFKKDHPKLHATFLTIPPKEVFTMDIEKGRPYKPK
jgi:hypothetical protein